MKHALHGMTVNCLHFRVKCNNSVRVMEYVAEGIHANFLILISGENVTVTPSVTAFVLWYNNSLH